MAQVFEFGKYRYGKAYGFYGYRDDSRRNEFGSGFNRALAKLAEIYLEKGRYGGDGDDFEWLLAVFHDACRRAGIPFSARNLVYPAMLRDRALEHYYENLNNVSKPQTLEELCDETRSYFQVSKYVHSGRNKRIKI
jgi:hypothetical protein